MGSVILGILTSSLQLICTGPLYLPVVAIISQPKYRITAVSYVFSYNIAFVIPLVIVLLLAAFVFKSEKIGVSRTTILIVKSAVVLMFIVMALILFANVR